MKKIFINIFLSLFIVLSLISLIFSALTLQQLINSPTFVVHVVDYPLQYYVEQTKLMELWEKYLIIVVSVSSFALLLSTCVAIIFNLPNRQKLIEKYKQNKTERTKRKIERLQSKIK